MGSIRKLRRAIFVGLTACAFGISFSLASPETERIKLEQVLKGNRTLFRGNASLGTLQQVDRNLRAEANKNLYLRENPDAALSKDFKKFILQVEELIEAHGRLAACARKDAAGKAKAEEILGFVDQYAALGLQKDNPTCSLAYAQALTEIDRGIEATVQKTTAQSNLKDFGKISNYVRDERNYASSTVVVNPMKQMYERAGIGGAADLTPMGRFVMEKYGFDQRTVERAGELHSELIQENRKNTVRNFVYYSQHFDFSGEKNMLGKSGKANRNAWIDAQFLNPGHPANSEYELYDAADAEAARIAKDYPKKRISLEDAYRELKPYFERLAKVRENGAKKNRLPDLFGGATAPVSKPKTVSKVHGVAIQPTALDRYAEGQQILDEALAGECGFLLQTETFRETDFGIGKTEAERKALLSDALKEAIGHTKSYAQFLAQSQSSMTNWGTQAKSKEDFAKTAKLLLYSSPAVIGKVLAERPELTGSLCEALRPEDDSLPVWVYLGGGALVLATGGIGLALAGVVAPAVIAGAALNVGFGYASAASLIQHETQLSAAVKKKSAVQGGQAGLNRYQSKSQAADLETLKKRIDELADAEIGDGIGIVTSFVGGSAIGRGAGTGKNLGRVTKESESVVEEVVEHSAVRSETVVANEAAGIGNSAMSTAYEPLSDARLNSFMRSCPAESSKLAEWRAITRAELKEDFIWAGESAEEAEKAAARVTKDLEKAAKRARAAKAAKPVKLSKLDQRMASDHVAIASSLVSDADRAEIAGWWGDATLAAGEAERRTFELVLDRRLSLLPKNVQKKVLEDLKGRVFEVNEAEYKAYFAHRTRTIFIQGPASAENSSGYYSSLMHELEHSVQKHSSGLFSSPFNLDRAGKKLFVVEKEAMEAEWHYLQAIPDAERARIAEELASSKYSSILELEIEQHKYGGLPLKDYLERQWSSGRYSQYQAYQISSQAISKTSASLTAKDLGKSVALAAPVAWGLSSAAEYYCSYLAAQKTKESPTFYRRVCEMAYGRK